MKNIRILILFISICCVSNVVAQNRNTRLIFIVSYKDKTIELKNGLCIINDANISELHACKFYISNLRLKSNNKKIEPLSSVAHLIDIADKSSQVIELSKPLHAIEEDSIIFDLGIDSITNVSGAIGGALDPTNGMYWTWQSGYINLMLEGNSPLSKARNKEFQFHLGGYMSPNNCLQTITLPCKNKDTIHVQLDLFEVFDNIDFTTLHHIMSPSVVAVEMSTRIAKSFYVVQK